MENEENKLIIDNTNNNNSYGSKADNLLKTSRSNLLKIFILSKNIKFIFNFFFT